MHSPKTFLALLAAGLLTANLVASGPVASTNDVDKKDAGSLGIDYANALEVREPAVGPRPGGRPRPDGPDGPGGRPGGRPGGLPGSRPNPQTQNQASRKCRRGQRDDCADDEIEEADDSFPSEASKSDSESDEHLEDARYQAMGKERSEALDKKLKEFHEDKADPKPDYDKKNVNSWEKGYENDSDKAKDVTVQDSKGKFESVDIIFRDLHLDPTTQFKGTYIKMKGQDQSKQHVMKSEQYFSERKEGQPGVIVASNNKMGAKSNDAPADKKLFWTDMTFQQLKSTRKNGAVDDVQFIIRDALNNLGTKDLIDRSSKDLDFQPNADGINFGTITNGPDPKQKMWFERLGGSRNGKGVFRMLEDYPTSFGGKNVKKIHVWESEDRKALAFELGV